MWVSSYPYHTQRGRKGMSDIKVCRCEHCEAHIPEDGHCRQKATEPDGAMLAMPQASRGIVRTNSAQVKGPRPRWTNGASVSRSATA